MPREIKLLSKAGLSEKEQSLLIKIGTYSFGACCILVAAFWVSATLLNRTGKGTTISRPGLQQQSEVNHLDVEAHLFVAKRQMSSSRHEQAIPHLQRALVVNSRDRTIRSKLSEALLNAGFFQRALSTIESLLLENPSDSLSPYLMARKGIALFYMGNHQQSLEALNRCLEMYPNSAEALCFLGQIEASIQLPSPKAVEYLNASIEADPGYVEGWYQLGRYYSLTGEYFKGRRLFLQALNLDPLHSRSHARLGTIYYYLKDADRAKKSYQTALAINPDDFNTRYNLGELYYNLLDDKHNALYHYKKTLEKNPLHPDANFKAGIICMSNRMVKEAIRYFENSLHSDRTNVRRLLQLAAAYEQLGDLPKAVKTYQEIRGIEPLNSIANQKIRFLSSD